MMNDLFLVTIRKSIYCEIQMTWLKIHKMNQYLASSNHYLLPLHEVNLLIHIKNHFFFKFKKWIHEGFHLPVHYFLMEYIPKYYYPICLNISFH